MASWRGYLVTKATDASAHATLETGLTDDTLMDGDVTVDVEFSSVNFKDALALTGQPGVVRKHPLIPGIDLVGTVAHSESANWSAGDRVLVVGQGIGESHHGGLAERARVPGDWLVRVPDGISSERAAAIGTAGFTAQLAVLALGEGGVDEVGDGEVLVTGATGGVGSIAIALLAANGFSVTAATGKESSHEYLRSLGATSIIDRAELAEPGKPLQSQRWAGAVDTVGGIPLANVLAQTHYGGTVTACGLAASSDLPATVMPFILRAVSLVGINSVYTPAERRAQAWERLERDLDLDQLDSMTTTVPLADAVGVAERLMAGSNTGRTVVDVQA